MRKSRFTEAQIIGMIKEQEAGMPTAEVCRRHGLSPATFYKLKSKYGGMEVSEAARLKALEDENGKPRQFCEDRYAFSLGLPELSKRMVEQNYFCWDSIDRNRAMNYAVIDVAPGRIRELIDGEHQVVFFYLYPSE